MAERRLSAAEFRRRIGSWFDSVARDLPWRRSTDPYHAWVSEIMLQQTRVEQALPYYHRFLSAFPSLAHLAEASLDEVLLTWEGLGYYSRARNLHRAAKLVVRDHGGAVPQTYAGLKALPGIGDYTASAVGSMAFGIPEAVLDGNVIRVLARYDALSADVTTSGARRTLRRRAQELLDSDDPGRHNEAMMELGATVCTPRSPQCGSCPISIGCLGFTAGTPEAFPVKSRRAKTPLFEIAIGIVRRQDGRVLIQRRPENGLLGGLWEFPGGKCEEGEQPEAACVREFKEELGISVTLDHSLPPIRHAYSHFRVRLHPYLCTLLAGAPRAREGQPFRWVVANELSDFAFPRANRKLIEQLSRVDAP